MRAVFHRDRDVPYEKSLRKHRSCGLVIQRKAFFFGYLSFVALDKRKLPAALVAEAFSV
jgi:hypothetical protein